MQKKEIVRAIVVVSVVLVVIVLALHVGGSAVEMMRKHLSGAGM
ncbi:MAG TPA: hypothetical protein PK542_02810 [Treponemataceae bacterium]|nr:hypothetical protein [Treponemataceae bacterium]HPS43397.1 hypothetical protein [Treponemataceae bacterium]